MAQCNNRVLMMVIWTLIAGGSTQYCSPVCSNGSVCAADQEQASDARTAAEPEPAEPVNAKRATEKQIKAYSGLMALVGILVAGLSLAALTILWAGRLRRQLRKPLPECEPVGRDFWFLKPPKPTVTQSQLPDWHLPPHQEPPPPPQS